MMTKIRKRLNQKGFTLVELMVVIAILGILAAIAIPKFSDSTSAANTAKIAADLRTIDSAIVMYQANGNTVDKDTTFDKLKDYLVGTPTPPKGKCYIDGAADPTPIKADDYKIDSANARATLDGKTAEHFTKTKTGTGTATAPASGT